MYMVLYGQPSVWVCYSTDNNKSSIAHEQVGTSHRPGETQRLDYDRDGLLLKESSEGMSTMYVERSFHLGMRSNVCRVLQPPAPRGITASQRPQASPKGLSQSVRVTPQAHIQKEQDTFPGNGERLFPNNRPANESFPSLMSNTGSQLMVEFAVPT
ncbi:hypothetical protein Bbelb_081170 [Branchiostoma belcheri]|nr:hypothetical protein Bbelb_081170 [Branchiostoma belcheri]